MPILISQKRELSYSPDEIQKLIARDLNIPEEAVYINFVSGLDPENYNVRVVESIKVIVDESIVKRNSEIRGSLKK